MHRITLQLSPILLLAACAAPAPVQPPAPAPAPPPSAGLVVTGIAILGEGLDGSPLTVRGRADQDPDPTMLRVAFALDGTDLPRDPNGAGPWQQTFTVMAGASQSASVVVDLAP